MKERLSFTATRLFHFACIKTLHCIVLQHTFRPPSGHSLFAHRPFRLSFFGPLFLIRFLMAFSLWCRVLTESWVRGARGLTKCELLRNFGEKSSTMEPRFRFGVYVQTIWNTVGF